MNFRSHGANSIRAQAAQFELAAFGIRLVQRAVLCVLGFEFFKLIEPAIVGRVDIIKFFYKIFLLPLKLRKLILHLFEADIDFVWRGHFKVAIQGGNRRTEKQRFILKPIMRRGVKRRLMLYRTIAYFSSRHRNYPRLAPNIGILRGALFARICRIAVTIFGFHHQNPKSLSFICLLFWPFDEAISQTDHPVRSATRTPILASG